MDRRTLIGLVLIALVFTAGVTFFKSPKEILIDGQEVTIKYGRHYIEAVMQPESTASFLVNNAFYDRSRIAGFFVIPMPRVRELKQQYGDFLHCNSPGAEAGKASLCSAYLFPLDSETGHKIKDVMKHRLNSPVIKITGNKLDIREHKFGTAKYYGFGSHGEYYYLISDIVITQQNYR